MKKNSIVLVAILVVSTLLAFIGCKTSPPSPPSYVPAPWNGSIVTAKVLDVIQLEGKVSWRWEMVVEIQASEDVPGMVFNFTKGMVGKTITMKANADVSELKGQVITAHVRMDADEHTPASYYATDIQKRTE